MQKPCKNNFHRVLIVGSYIVAQIVVFLNLCYNIDVALEHMLCSFRMLEQTARKGSLFLLSFMPSCVILESEFLAKPAVIKNTAVFLFSQ